jgi:hypothetical protein
LGNPRRETCGRLLSMPVVRARQPRTNTRKCGNQPAHQSLQTVVSAALPPAVRSNHTRWTEPPMNGDASSRLLVLTTNIRVSSIDETAKRPTSEAYKFQVHETASRIVRLVLLDHANLLLGSTDIRRRPSFRQWVRRSGLWPLPALDPSGNRARSRKAESHDPGANP